MIDKETNPPPGGRKTRLTAALLLAIVVSGALFTWWMTVRADREMRDILLLETGIGARAINIDHVKKLTGTSADLDSPDYLRLKKQFASMLTTNKKLRFIYLMGRKANGSLFFYADDRPVGHAEEAPAGMLYDDAPEGFRRVMETGVASIEGPFTDKWGAFISGCVPLFDPETGKTLAVFAIDFDAGSWHWEIASRTALPVGLLLVLLMGAIVAFVSRNRGERLRKSEEKHRILFDNSPDAYLVLAAGVVVDCNQAAETMLRGTRKQIIGLSPDKYSPEFQPDGSPSAESAAEKITEALRTGNNSFEWVHRRLDGSDFWVMVSTNEMKLNGEPVLFATWADITERKQAEEALHESEARLNQLAEQNRTIIWEVDDRGLYLFASHVSESVIGYRAEELVGRMHFYDLHPESERSAFKEAALSVFERKESFKNLENVVQSKDGRQIWVSTNGIPLLNADGTLQGYRGSDTDITERKQAEVALRESEETIHLLLDSMAEAIYGIDMDGNCTFCNNTCLHLLGYKSPDELLGKNMHWQIHSKHPDGTHFPVEECRIFRAFHEGKGVHVDDEVLWRSDDTSFPAEYWSYPLQRNGVAVGAVVTFFDTTERRAQEKKLREVTDRLTLATQGAGVGIWDYDVVNNRLVWDDQMFRLYGITADQFVGAYEAWQAGVHPEDRQRGDEEIQMALRGEKDFDTEFRVSWPDGSVHNIRALAQVQRDTSGQPLHMIGTNWDITVRKQADEALRASKEDLNLALQSSRMGVWNWDIRNNRRIFDNQTCELLGLNPETFGGLAEEFFAAVHPEDRESVKEALSKTIQADLPYEPEYRAVWADGSIHNICARGRIIRDDKGKAAAICGILWDITERKRAEEALKNSEERFKQLSEVFPETIFEANVDGYVTYTNRNGRELFGYTEEDFFNGVNIINLVVPEDRIMVTKRVQDRLQGVGSTGYLEYRALKKDGSTFNALGLSVPITMNGMPVGLRGFILDITGRKEAEEALREAEVRMRSITDSAQDAIIMMDAGGLVSYWNPAAERIFGYTSAEAIGQNLHSFIVPPRYHGAHLAAFPAFQQTGQGSAVGKMLDLEARRKDGKEIAVQLSLSSIQIDGSWHAVGLIRDVTERKLAEEALRNAKDAAEVLSLHLEKQTALATEMAAQAQMASTAKSEFLANMSHEIRTPMNGVIGMTGLLLDTKLNEEQRKYAETVRASGESLLGIINDILDFSKIEAGKLELETLNFDLRALLDDFAATLALRAHDKGLEFICAAAPEVPAYLQGDPGRLRQILTNLTGNAVKFTHQGEIAVRANLVTETDTEAVLRFSVKDTGIGIPADKQDLMFQKFTQADASTTRQYGGTGLGLAISKELTSRMGGEIGVLSEEGRGSEFWFTVRLGKQPEGTQPESLLPADIRGVHMLIVDDNATNREILLVQFASWGVRAEEAPDGPTALSALSRAKETGDPFLAAILDMQMPGMDGAALAEAIKADEALKDTRLVLMTSLGHRGDAKRMAEIGFAAYLIKPARHSELFGCLSTVLADTPMTKTVPSIVTRHTIREMRRATVRILLAEDNIVNQQVAVGILKKLGLRADAVANGAEAVKALETLPYDLVLMDVQMPEMNGYEATRKIRDPQSSVRNHQIPIIAMTANAMQGDREKCLEAGMNDYVPKPVSPQLLAEVLEKWLPRETEATTEHATGITEEETPVSAKEPGAPVFDRAGMMARLMDDEDLARMVTESFLEDIPRQIELLKDFLKAGDATGAERQAHTIKGASANVGGEALRAVAFEMEKFGKAGDLEAVTARLPEMENQFELLKEAMVQHFSLG